MLWNNKLYINQPKCEFVAHKVHFVGFVISVARICTNPQKVEVIKSWPTPNIFEIHSCQRFANFYRRFIQDFNSLATPLMKSLKAKSFKWGLDQENNFNN